MINCPNQLKPSSFRMSTIILSFLVLLISFSLVHGDPNVPCYFIFGDSLSDAGNNNDLDTKAKVNYSPYGVDFPGGVATGRFTNGLTTPDVLTGLLGLEGLIPPFRTASGNKILKGVNYASGGAGVLSESGSHLGDRIWLARQVQNHQKTIADLGAYVKGPVSDYLNKCLYTVNIGSNDYINNYFMPKLYPSKNVSTPDQFATSVISEYEAQIKALYKLGARKTALFGLGMIGCVPAEKRINKATLCVDEINDAVELINDKLLSLVDSLNAQLAGAKFTFIDISGVQGVTPLALGLLTTPCCKLRSDYQCEASKSSCLVRDIYSFMDGFHPTEVVNRLTAKISYSSPLHLFVHPVNIRDLVSNLNHTVQTSYRPDPIQRISYVQDLASSADVSSF